MYMCQIKHDAVLTLIETLPQALSIEINQLVEIGIDLYIHGDNTFIDGKYPLKVNVNCGYIKIGDSIKKLN